MSSYEGRGSLPYRPENDPYTPTYAQPLPVDTLVADGKTQLLGVGGLKQTMEAIRNATRASIAETKTLAKSLKSDTLKQSAYNVWHFLKTNLKYKLDKAGTEQVRTAARSWADRKKGIDCEDFSIFAYALLTNMGYSPKFEIVAFNGKKEFGHIYVIVGAYTVDAVMDLFDKKPANITKFKHMDIYGLTGDVEATEFGALGARSYGRPAPTTRNYPPTTTRGYPPTTTRGYRSPATQQIDPQIARWKQSLAESMAQLKALPSGNERSQAWFNGPLGRQIRKVKLLIRAANPRTRALVQDLAYYRIYDVKQDGTFRWKGGVPDEIKNKYPSIQSLQSQGILSGIEQLYGVEQLYGLGEYTTTVSGLGALGDIGMTSIASPESIYGIGALAPPDEITQIYIKEAARLLPLILRGAQSNKASLRNGATARRWRKLRYLIKMNGMPQERAIVARMMPFILDVNLRNYSLTLKKGVTNEILEDYNALKRLQSAARRVGVNGIEGLGAAEISAIDQTISAVDNALAGDDVSGAGEALGSFFKRIGRGLKAAINKIKKFQPLRFAAKIGLAPVRGAFLLLLRVNLFKMSSMLKYGYVTDEQVKRFGLNINAVNKARGTIKKLKQIWYDAGGDPEVLKNTIVKGGGGLSGVELMGEIGAAPFAAALATAAPIIGKVKLLLSVAAPAIKAIAGKMRAAQTGEPAPPPPPEYAAPPQANQQPSAPQESVQGLGEVGYHRADDVAAAELLGMLNDVGVGKINFRAIWNKAKNLIAPPSAPSAPNFNARPSAFTPAPQPSFTQSAARQTPPSAFTPAPQANQRQAAPSAFDNVLNIVQKAGQGAQIVQAAKDLLTSKQNVNNAPTPQADGYENAQQQSVSKEIMRQGGDGAPGPGETNVIAPSGGGGEKKDNTMLFVVGGVAVGALLLMNK